MEEAEPPECPICLQPYAAVSTIPRVLACGHTTCEACLKQLPKPFPDTIRCTVCTILVKCPNGPSSLPKNLDLLHFSSFLQHGRPTKNTSVNSQPSPPQNGENRSILFPLTLKSWSYEFYCRWKKWILPEDCISAGPQTDDDVVCGKVSKAYENEFAIGCVLQEREDVILLKIGVFIEGEEDSRVFNSSYVSRIVTVLYQIREEERNRIRIILTATHRVSNVGKVYGFWHNEDDNGVYMVFEKFTSPDSIICVINKNEDEIVGLSTDRMSVLGMIGMEICEILSYLHCEGLVIGLLSMASLSFNDFGRVRIDLSNSLNAGRRLNMLMQKDDEYLSCLLNRNLVFTCPEMLLRLLVKEHELDGGKSRFEVECASDVWSLACLLVWVILGRPFVEELKSLFSFVANGVNDGNGFDCSPFYMVWLEKIVSLLQGRLGLECAPLQKILCTCLEFEPGNRPVMAELWKCLRNLVIETQIGDIIGLNMETRKESSGHCIVLADFFRIFDETGKELVGGLLGKDENDEADVGLKGDRDIAFALTEGRFKYIEMKGHRDCISGLAIAGDFLFSSSYDKIVNVWSLQDFKFVQSCRGHEHRVMAIASVGGEQPLCISGDNEGVICVWKATSPLSEVPIKKLQEKKDWRYSGIHAMAVSGTQYLYTGSGDTLVKAWSLLDYTLSCSMSGHKSVVSSLIVSGGVLYSGSWDGTVRLWSLVDHCLLAALGEDRNISSVLSLSVDRHLLFVGHENGSMKVWHNDLLIKSLQAHKGAVFVVSKNGKWLFSGGWDKTISAQETSEDVNSMEVTPIGSISCNSTVTALEYWQGKLFVGQADKIIKVYYGV